MEYGIGQSRQELGELAHIVAGAVDYLEAAFDDLKSWSWSVGSYDTLAQCLLDAVFSVRARHSDVDRALAHWCELIAEEKVAVDTAEQCAQAFAGVNSSAAAIALPANKIAGRSKREIAVEIARVLAEQGVTDVEDFRNRVWDNIAVIREAWLGVFGLGHGSWCHMRVLADAGLPDPCPQLRRKLSRLGGATPSQRSTAISYEEALDVLLAVADRTGIHPLLMEYALMIGPDVPVASGDGAASTMDNHAKVGAAH